MKGEAFLLLLVTWPCLQGMMCITYTLLRVQFEWRFFFPTAFLFLFLAFFFFCPAFLKRSFAFVRNPLCFVDVALFLGNLFTVESEQDSYNGELHDRVTMGCRFSRVPSVSGVSVIWRRIKPLPSDEVYLLDKGKENQNGTSALFRPRVRLLREELERFRAVIEISPLRLNDSGTYRCIVIHDGEADYKQTALTIRGQFTLQSSPNRAMIWNNVWTFMSFNLTQIFRKLFDPLVGLNEARSYKAALQKSGCGLDP